MSLLRVLTPSHNPQASNPLLTTICRDVQGCELDNVVFVPLGVKEGGTHDHASRVNNERKYVLSFATLHVNSVRTAMVTALLGGVLDGVEARDLRIIYPGQDEMYTETMLSSLTALCPPGNSPDTWRHFEAMDAGIPCTAPTAPVPPGS